MSLIVGSLNVPCLMDVLGEEGHHLRELAAVNCCTHLDSVLEEKLPGLRGEVVAVKHKDCIWVALLLEDVDPLLDHCVDRGCLLELLVGVHKLAVKKDGLSIGESSCQLIDPQSYLYVKKNKKD